MSQSESDRGVVLVVDAVLERGWFRSQIKAIPHFLGDDQSPGIFRAAQLNAKLGFAMRPIATHNWTDIRVEPNVPVYLVCHGRHWRVGDAIPMNEIVYRFER